MKIDSMEKLIAHEMKDLWSASKQVLDLTSTLNKAASDTDLDNAINGIREQITEQVSRIETLFEDLEFGPQGHKCKGMEGLVNEAREFISDTENPDVRDAGVISQVQRILHYFIAGYGTTATLTEKAGRRKHTEVLQKSLDEIGDADKKLSRLAERKINFEALVAG